MLLIIATAILSMSQTPAQTPATQPDRSGEPALRQLLTDMGKLRRVEIIVNKSARSNRSGIMQPDRIVTLDYDSPVRFRIMETGSFGDSNMYVSDGKVLMADPLDDTQKTVLTRVGKTIYDSDKALALKGGNTSLLFYFLAGPDSFNNLVSTDSTITVAANTISFKSKDAGSGKIFYGGQPGRERVTRCEYDNLPFYQERASRFGGFGRIPDAPLTVADVTYEANPHFEAALFAAKPHDPKNVDDKTKTKG